jgi:PAS domain S-box-containing protein
MASVQKIKTSELRYRRLFKAAQDGILILDVQTGAITDVNPFLSRMQGYWREEFVQKKLWEVGAFKDIKASQEAFEALQKNEYIRYENLPRRAKSGILVVLFMIAAFGYLIDGFHTFLSPITKPARSISRSRLPLRKLQFPCGF